MTSSVEATDAASKAVQKTPNRISLDYLKSRILTKQFINPEIQPTMTLCLVQHVNGFIVIGKAAPADPANFNALLGRQFAEEDAIRQLWPLEAFALLERGFA